MVAAALARGAARAPIARRRTLGVLSVVLLAERLRRQPLGRLCRNTAVGGHQHQNEERTDHSLTIDRRRRAGTGRMGAARTSASVSLASGRLKRIGEPGR